MPLELQNVAVGSTSKKPVFETITIVQGRDGRMSASGQYRVDLVLDADGSAIAGLGTVGFVVSHEELVANPDFAEGYRIIRNLARAGLQSLHPEFVTLPQAEPPAPDFSSPQS